MYVSCVYNNNLNSTFMCVRHSFELKWIATGFFSLISRFVLFGCWGIDCDLINLFTHAPTFCASQELHFHQVVSYLFLKVWVCIVNFYAPIARHLGIMFAHVCTSHIWFLLNNLSSLKEVIWNLCKMKPSLISNLFTLTGSGGIRVLWAHSYIIYVALSSTIIILQLNLTMNSHLDVPNLQYQLIHIHAIMLWCPYKQLINTLEFIRSMSLTPYHMIHISSMIFPHPSFLLLCFFNRIIFRQIKFVTA